MSYLKKILMLLLIVILSSMLLIQKTIYEFMENNKNIKICILIISVENRNKRWTLEKKIWEKYMNTNKNIDCYFIECGDKEKPYTLINSCTESYKPGIYQKTISSLNKIKKIYDFYVRTNLSSFIIFDNLINTLKNITHDKPVYMGKKMWNHKDNWTSGTSIIFNHKAKKILTKYGKKKNYYLNDKIADDVLIGKVFKDNNIISDTSKYNILYFWDYTKKDNMSFIKNKSYCVIRLRNDNDLLKYKNAADNLLKVYYNID